MATHLVDEVENGSPDPELRARLAQRRVEKQRWERELEALRSAQASRLPEPTEAWVSEQFATLGRTLAEGPPAAALALRALVGEVVVEQIERAGHSRHFLRARFTMKAASLVHAVAGLPDPPDDTPATEFERGAEIVLDLRELAPWERIIHKAMELWDKGWLNQDIAKELGHDRNQVAKAINEWHTQRGLEPPDGRSRWRQLGSQEGHDGVRP